MINDDVRQYVADALASQIHDGNFSQRVNLNDLFLTIETVTAMPTAQPSNFYGQFKIYNGKLYIYDFLTNTWLSAQPSGSYQAAGSYLVAKFNYFADANNTTTTETDLYSSSLAAGLLATNGDKVFGNYQGIFTGAIGATQDLRVYFGGTKIYDSGALSVGALTANWTLRVMAMRESSSVVRCSVSVNSDFATLFPYSAYTRVTGLTLTNAQILKITGQAAGGSAASNQITATIGDVSYEPAA